MAYSGAPSVIDLMLFHTTERNCFARLRRLGCDPEKMNSVMALWLWLESIGHHDFIRHVYSYEDPIVLQFVKEAELCLEVLANPSILTAENYEIPSMAWQVNEPIDLRFFEFNREVAVAGISRILHSVCRIIFNDKLMEQAARDMNHPASKSIMSSGLIVRPFGEGSSNRQGEMAVANEAAPPAIAPSTMAVHSPGRSTVQMLNLNVPPAPAPPVIRSMLNPQARPWAPAAQVQSTEDQRSMFITFSKGHPISREDIMEFFTQRYGPCVETVMIEKVLMGHRPMYGRIVFSSPSMIATVLNEQRTAKFLIKGKHLWARMYVSRHN